MKQRLIFISVLFLFSLSFSDCAKRGRPTGGLKDSIPPVIIKNSPENYSINFNENEIKIYFDEYIKLKDVQKELIISPPFDNPPTITPLSTSKQIRIKFKDTLKENTTYSFNFGKSIIDNNEGNSLDYFKYIFSTGTYIDSLSLKGRVNDALLLEPENSTTVMLYEISEGFNDSIIFNKKPTYITITQDSTQNFEITNVKKGNYLLIALKEKNNDYIFQPRNDKIAFVKKFISIPTDSSYTLTLFKEVNNYRLAKPKHESKNHIIFGYEGKVDNLDIQLASIVSPDFEAVTFKDLKKDTIHYWFKPAFENDSLSFYVRNQHRLDTLITKMRDLYQDTLKISALNAGLLTPNDTLKLTANTPIKIIDPNKIKVIKKDSTEINSTSNIIKNNNSAAIIFNIEEEQSYTITLFPGAVKDFFETVNDTLQFRVTTKPLSDYGTLTLELKNATNYPYIIQLVDKRFKVISEQYTSKNEPLFFDFINPGYYYIRIIEDINNNKSWDTGNYLKKIQPEKVSYYPSLLEIRANWSLNETFNIN